MKAENRLLSDWFTRLRTGQLRLPRFQRYEAWGHGEISSLLESVLRGLPSGATLVLEVVDDEQFVSRPISGAPDPSEPCTEHLLDGQQRLTALWKSINDLYDDRTYYVYFKSDDDHGGIEIPWIYGQARWWKDGTRFPAWCDNPTEVFRRGYLPMGLLRTEQTIGQEIRSWCDRATAGDLAASRELEDRILALRHQLLNYNVPYLSLPATTSSAVALDVFIKLNTTSVRLSSFDIIVARFEDETGQSLRQLASQLTNVVPQVERYVSPEDLILSAAAMREGYAPTQANYQRLDLPRLSEEWSELTAGIKWAIECLERECVFDEARLPTSAVLPVLAALYAEETKAIRTTQRESEALARKYIWRAFLTRRYENSVPSRALQDLRGLRFALVGHGNVSDAPIFDGRQFPLPTVEELMLAGWPKRRDMLARAILAISFKAGALDVADNEPASPEHLRLRDYQHLFPYVLLTGDGQMPGSETYRALNCALLTWNAARALSGQGVRRFFGGRGDPARVSPEEIDERLKTHLVPVSFLPSKDYGRIRDSDDRAEKIRVDYQTFLRARAELMEAAIMALCEGKDWPRQGAAGGAAGTLKKAG